MDPEAYMPIAHTDTENSNKIEFSQFRNYDQQVYICNIYSYTIKYFLCH